MQRRSKTSSNGESGRRPFNLYWFLLCAALTFFLRAAWAWHGGAALSAALTSALSAAVGVGLLILLVEFVARRFVRRKDR
jgi:hypothetical protein